MILFALYNKTNAFISPPALTMCFFFYSATDTKLNVASVRMES